MKQLNPTKHSQGDKTHGVRNHLLNWVSLSTVFYKQYFINDKVAINTIIESLQAGRIFTNYKHMMYNSYLDEGDRVNDLVVCRWQLWC